MSQQDGFTLPELPLGFGDLGVLRDIVQAYLAFLPRAGISAQEKQTQMHLLKGVLFKLADIPKQAVETRIVLSVGEIYALSCAIQVFIVFVNSKVSPSRERDETLQDVARLRQCLLDLLPRSSARNRV
jgi:hypothetical protein